MANVSHKHPEKEQLVAFGLGKLEEDAAEQIAQHLDSCHDCSETILNLQDDTFVALVRRSPAPQSVKHVDLASVSDEQVLHQETVDVASGATGSKSRPEELPPELHEHPRYEIVGLIGKGGMGDVYRARHRKMDRTVALKVINRDLVCKPEAVDRFHREVKAAARLSHPNIVTAYDADQAGDYHFMVMEYVDGVDLSHIIRDRGALPIAEACDYVRQAAIGLQHAHEQGMVHRDIKPHNLMATADSTVKILDFGLASLAPVAIPDSDSFEARGDLTAVGAIMGTPDFISPEQAEDAHQADIRSDIYSLGTTLYFLLSGRPPFVEGSVMHKLKSHAQAEPEPLGSVREDIPADLAAVVSKMIAKDPDQRFQTPAEVAAALESFSQITEPVPEESSRHQVQPHRKRRRFLPLVAVATLFLAAIAAAAVFYIQLGKTTLRFEISDPNVSVRFARESISVDTLDNKTFRVEPATEQKFVVYQNGTEIETDSLTLRRGQKIVLKIDVVEGQIKIASNTPETQISQMPSEIESPALVESEMLKAALIDAAVELVLREKPEIDEEKLRGDIKLKREIEKEIGDRREDDPEFLMVTAKTEKMLQNGNPVPDAAQRIAEAKRTIEEHRLQIGTHDPLMELVALWLPQHETGTLTPVRTELLAHFLASEVARQSARKEIESDVLKKELIDVVLESWKEQGHNPDRKALQERVEKAIVEFRPSMGGGMKPEFEFLIVSLATERKLKAGLPIHDASERVSQAVRQLRRYAGVPSHPLVSSLLDRHKAATLGPVRTELLARLLIAYCYQRHAPEGAPSPDRWFSPDDENAGQMIQRLTKKHGHLVPKLQKMFSEAAGIPNPQWHKFAADPKASTDAIKGEPLSLVLWKLNPLEASTKKNLKVLQDFQYIGGVPKPRQLSDAMFPSQVYGYYSMIQPHYISGLTFDLKKGSKQLKGNFRFQAPSLYAGKIEYVVQITGDDLRVVEFTLPNYGITIARDDEGVWQRSQPEMDGNVQETTGDSDDHKNIQGTWQVTYSEDSGRIAPQEMLKNIRFVFTEHTMTKEIAGRKGEAAYKLNPSTNPKSVDFTENGRTKAGIYDLQGDTLRICIAEGRPERPTAFDSQPDSPNDLIIMLKRIRPGEETTSAATQIKSLKNALDIYKLDNGTYPSSEEGLTVLVHKPADENRAKNWGGPYLKDLPTDPWGNAFGYEFPGNSGGDASKPDIWSRGPDGKDNTADDITNWVREPNKVGSSTRTIFDQGYKIIDNGKEIGSRRLVVTEEAQMLSIVEEYSLAMKWEVAPLGIVERDFSADYSLAGEEPLILRGATSTKEQGSLVMHGTVEFKNAEALASWTSYTERGRKLETPRKQQATVKPPSGPLVLGSTIQVVGPLLLPTDGERRIVLGNFDDHTPAGKPLVEYEAGCRLRRTTRPDGAGFTITLSKPGSDEPEMTLEYDTKGNCENVRMGSTTVMKPHGTPSRAEAAWRTDIVAFEKHLGKLSADARVPGKWRGPDADVVPITNGTHGYIDLNPAKDTVQFRVNEALKGRTVNWELELAQDGQEFGSTLRLRPVCEGDAKENEKATPFLNFLILRSPRVPRGASGFKAGDRVKLEGTIGDFANNKRINVTFSPAGPVAIYHSDASSHPVFWVGFTEVTITLVDAGDLAKELDDLEGRLKAEPQYLMQLLAEDRDKGESLLRAGQKQRPTARPWAMDIQMLFAGDVFTGKSLQGKEKVAHFKHALEYLQESYDIAVQTLDKFDDEELQAALPGLRLDLALAALEAGKVDTAKQHAAETLRKNTARKNWNDGNIVHNANQILGRCALREGKLADAKAYLLKAGATPGSPQLNSYGPQMQLARELLEKGEKETVLEYLDLVARFWANPDERTEANSKSIAREHLNQLEAWKKQLRAGNLKE